MNIVSLTTDFGTKDYYAGMLKGGILSVFPQAILVDISHEIESYNIVQGAYMLKNAYASFPKGTVHLLSVNNFYQAQPRFLAIFFDGYYFVGADNGQFSLLFGNEIPEYCYELPKRAGNLVLDVNKIFISAVAHLLNSRPLSDIGTATQKLLQRFAIQPVILKDRIRGSVVHIDKYENVSLNIDRAVFERVGRGRAFELYFKRFDPITVLSQNYASVPMGEVLCLFNSGGFLEISIYLDKAASLLGLAIGDMIEVNFL